MPSPAAAVAAIHPAQFEARTAAAAVCFSAELITASRPPAASHAALAAAWLACDDRMNHTPSQGGMGGGGAGGGDGGGGEGGGAGGGGLGGGGRGAMSGG